MHRFNDELSAFGKEIKAFARTYLLAFPRAAAFLGATILVVLFALWAYAQGAGPAAYRLVEPLSSGGATDMVVAGVTMLPLVLLAAALSLVWAGVVSFLAGGALSDGEVSTARAARRSAARLWPATLVVLAWVLAVALALVLTPVTVVLGILGLVAWLLVGHERWNDRRPSRGVLIALAIPLALPAIIAVRWALALPAVWLDSLGAKAALARSWDASAGRALRIGAVLVSMYGLVALLTASTGVIGNRLDPTGVGSAVAQVMVQLLLGAAPMVACTVLYLRARTGSSTAASALVAPRRGARVAKVAGAMAVVLVAQAVLIPGAATPAAAADLETPRITFVTNPSEPLTPDSAFTLYVQVAHPFQAEGIDQPSGDITISVDGTPLTGPFTIDMVPFSAAIDVEVPFADGLPEGSHSVELEYPGDANYTAQTGVTSLEVGAPASVTLTGSDATRVFGETLTLVANVTADSATAGGTVEFFATRSGGAKTSLGTATIDGSGDATLGTSTLVPGDYSLSASYLGDAGGTAADSSSTAVSISAVFTEMTIAVTPEPYPTTPVAAGSESVVLVTVGASSGDVTPTGTVALYMDVSDIELGSQALVDGTAEFTVVLPPGAPVVRASFNGTAGFYGSVMTAQQYVAAWPSTMVLTTPSASSAYGTAFDLTATVTSTSSAPGDVEFFATPSGGAAVSLGTATLAGGAATLSVVGLSAGDYSLTASYAGSVNVASADAPAIAHGVGKGAAIVTVTPDADVPYFGTSILALVDVSAAVSGLGPVTGTVTLFRDDVELETIGLVGTTGAVNTSFAVGDAGAQTLRAQYNGNANYAVSEGTAGVTARQRDVTVHTTSAPFLNGEYGDSFVFEGGVAPVGGSSVPTGDVELWADGYLLGTDTLDGFGRYSMTTDAIPVRVNSITPRVMVIKYLGDVNHAAAQSDGGVLAEIVKKGSVPLIGIGPAPVGLGGTYTLSATLDVVADGPGGTVTFSTLADGVIGTVPVVDGVAQMDYKVTDLTTWFDASYSGDANYEATDAVQLRLDADRAVALVEMTVQPADLDPFVYGKSVELVVKVELGDASEPLGTVDLRTASNVVVAEDLPVTYFPTLGYGLARITVCSGDLAGCPMGVAVIGYADQDLIAYYPEGAESFAGQSEPMAYSMSRASTALSLEVVPEPVSPGGGMYFVATVTNTGSDAVPRGQVSFYGLTPNSSGGVTEAFIANAVVGADGVARLTTSAGSGSGELRWPADGVIARYFGGSYFEASFESVPVTINRISTDLTVWTSAPKVGDAATVQVSLHGGPGVADPFTGQVTVTSDEGATCSAWVPEGVYVVTCPIRWSTAGDHSVWAEYSDTDPIYLPATSDVFDVAVARRVTHLNAVVSVSQVAGVPTEVTWDIGEPEATGTVTVWADGVQWCVVDIQVGECAGTFQNASADGEQVEVRLQYRADAPWVNLEELLSVRVKACAAIAVDSSAPKLGSVTVETPSNCGDGGYVEGTKVALTAHPIAPAEFAGWRRFDVSSPGLIAGVDTLATTMTVTHESWTWVHVADFRIPCYPVTTSLTGYGYLYASVDPNCEVPGGGAGYAWGTAVTLTPSGLNNPAYGVADRFYSLGTLPAGAVVDKDFRGQTTISLVVKSAKVIPVEFGPRCLTVTVDTDPSSEGDTGGALSSPNCFSPFGEGYLPLSSVVVESSSGNPNMVLAAWKVNGVNDATLGNTASPTIELGTANVEVTGVYLGCYTVDLVVDGALQWIYQVGSAALSPAANCPDGSDRYVAGTEVTATPSVDVEGAVFRGWDDNLAVGTGGVAEVGELPESAKTFVVTGSTTLTAVFFLGESCSRLNVSDRDNLVTFGPTGCGPGYYDDTQKRMALQTGEKASDLYQQRYRSMLSVTKNPGTNLDVYASVRGDTRGCFGVPVQGAGPTVATTGWTSLGKLGSGQEDCWVAGDVLFRFEQCQTLNPDIAITRAGDDSGAVYSKRDLPSTLFLPTDAGNFAPMQMSNYEWVATQPLSLLGGEFVFDGQAPGPCADAGNAYQPGMTLMLGGDTPTSGIEFQGWTSDELEPLIEDNPVVMETDDSRAVMAVSAAYEMTCFHVAFGEGISIEGEAPRCPGYTDEENMFIAGTGMQVRAQQHLGSRNFAAWESGVITSTSVKLPVTGHRLAIAYVTGNMTVAVDYPTEGERLEAGAANAGKVLLAVAAVAAPIAVSIACPPCGVFIAVVGVVAAATSFIPGAEKVTAFFDLVNPTAYLECATNWGLGNGKDASGTDADIESVKEIKSAAKKSIKILKPPPTAAQLAAKTAKTLTKSSKSVATKAVVKAAGKDAFQLAAFGYSLYDAGLFSADLGYQTVDQLRDTATFTNCVDETTRLKD